MPNTPDYNDFSNERFHTFNGICEGAEFIKRMSDRLSSSESECYMLTVTIEDFDSISSQYDPDVTTTIREKLIDILSIWTGSEFTTAYTDANTFFALMESDIFGGGDVREFFDAFEEACAPIHIFIHMGIYKITDRQLPISDIFKYALEALKKTDNDKGNSFSFYDKNSLPKTDNAAVFTGKNVADEIENAIDKEHFKIYLQPQLDVLGKVVGAEALVRWEHPEKGVLSPAHFLDVLEKENLIYLIDRYVWELAVSQLSEWQGSSFEDLHISINISGKDFYYLDIYSILTELAVSYHIEPSKLFLEITEECFDINANCHTINRLKDFGFTLVIDKYGSATASLKRLADIEVSAIKMDISVIKKTA